MEWRVHSRKEIVFFVNCVKVRTIQCLSACHVPSYSVGVRCFSQLHATSLHAL